MTSGEAEAGSAGRRLVDLDSVMPGAALLASGPEQQLVIKAEIEDGALGFEDYKRDQFEVSSTGVIGVLQAALSHDEGSFFSEEEWVLIIGEMEDEMV